MNQHIYYKLITETLTFCLPLNNAPDRPELADWDGFSWDADNVEHKLLTRIKTGSVYFRILPNNWLVFWQKEKEGTQAATIPEMAEALIATRESGNNQTFWEYFS